MNDQIRLFEVGPRDGLQNEKNSLSIEDRFWLVQALARAGVSQIEAGSFVRADRVPQMADSDRLHGALIAKGLPGDFFYLVPNEVGLDRAIQAGVRSIAVFTAASESFNQRNIGMSIQQSLDGISKIISTANAHGIKVRGYVSTAFGCPFEGRMDPSQPMKVMKALIDLGIPQVSIGDTIGVASVKGVDELVRPAIEAFGAERLAVHFHDTRGTALVNSFRAFELGIRTFDASVGGLGGCPFAPGASGNLATEDLVYFFKEMGVESGVDYKKLCELSLELARRMGKTVLSSRALQAYQANCQRQSVWDS